MYDHGLDLQSLILKLDLDLVKMYHHTLNEVSMSTASKVTAQIDTHIHTRTDILQKHIITSTAYDIGNNTPA